jgi:chaperonin GroEL
MSQQESFVAAILEAPQENDLRLVYADWLEDQGDPRAGCVRLAVRLRASYGPRHPDAAWSFWERVRRDTGPSWWVDEACRLAEEVANAVGDGSKTAVLIALSLVEATLLFPESREGIDAAALRDAAAQALAAINPLVVPATSREQLGRCLRTAALGDEAIAAALLSAYELAGPDGCIHVKSPPPGEAREKVRVTAQQGLHFSLEFEEDAEGRTLEDVAVLVAHRPLKAEEVRLALSVYRQRAPTLLCLCPGLDTAGAELFRDAVRAGDRILLCTAPQGRWRDCFSDVAAATGAAEVHPLESVPATHTIAQLGRAGSARVMAGRLVIEQPTGPQGRRQHWITNLRQLVANSAGEEQEWHAQRLAQFTGGVLTIEVCGESPAETEQLHGRACGALHTGRAMIAEGFVPGGGVAYLRAAKALKGPASQALGWALEEPVRALLVGTDLHARGTLLSLRAHDLLGLDVVRGELPPWRTEGPLDSLRVVRTVLECALAAAPRLFARLGG